MRRGGVLGVDLLQEPLRLGDLGVEVRRLDGRRDLGAPLEPLGDRGEVGAELGQPRPVHLDLDAGEVELALELADLAHVDARLLVEPGRVLGRHVRLELALDLVELALAARDLLVERPARLGRPVPQGRLRERLVLGRVQARDQRGLVGLAGLGLDPDHVGLVGGGLDGDDLLLEVVRQGLGRERVAVAVGGGADGRERRGVGPGQDRGRGADGDLGRLLEHERLVHHARGLRAGRRGHARAVAGRVDEEQAVGLVGRRDQGAHGGAERGAEQGQPQDQPLVAAEHLELVHGRPPGLRAGRRGGGGRGRDHAAAGRARGRERPADRGERRAGAGRRRRLGLVEVDPEPVVGAVAHRAAGVVGLAVAVGLRERVADLDGRRSGLGRRRRDGLPRRERPGAVAGGPAAGVPDLLEHGVRRAGAGGRARRRAVVGGRLGHGFGGEGRGIGTGGRALKPGAIRAAPAPATGGPRPRPPHWRRRLARPADIGGDWCPGPPESDGRPPHRASGAARPLRQSSTPRTAPRRRTGVSRYAPAGGRGRVPGSPPWRVLADPEPRTRNPRPQPPAGRPRQRGATRSACSRRRSRTGSPRGRRAGTPPSPPRARRTSP